MERKRKSGKGEEEWKGKGKVSECNQEASATKHMLAPVERHPNAQP